MKQSDLKQQQALKDSKEVIADIKGKAVSKDGEQQPHVFLTQAFYKAAAYLSCFEPDEYSKLLLELKRFKIKVEVQKEVSIFFKKNKSLFYPTQATHSTISSSTEDIAYTKSTFSLHKIGKLKPDSLILYDENGNPSLFQHSQAAVLIAPLLSNAFAYDAVAKTWFTFTGTHFEVQKDSAKLDEIIIQQVFIGTESIGFANGYWEGIRKLITATGFLKLNTPPDGLIPFANGLLSIKDKVLHPVTVKNAFTWCLPYQYTPKADCPNIKQFLKTSVDRCEETTHFLRAWLAALLHGRADLQVFLHLMGKGGTGKSTFLRLATALVGKDNAVSTRLHQMENNQFETAGFYKKRLIQITDSDKYGGSIDVLKAITGQDPIRLERKHQQQAGSFIFDGMVIVASNEPLQFTDHSSGLERRRLTVKFERRVTDDEKSQWQRLGGEEKVLHTEMPGLINWLLELSQDEITQAIKSPPKPVIEANREAARSGNPVADWMQTHCIPEFDAKGRIGVKKEIRESGEETRFEDADIHLYPNYLQWSLRHGRNPVSHNRFSHTLVDTASFLGHHIEKKRDGTGIYIHGLRLAKDWENPIEKWVF